MADDDKDEALLALPYIRDESGCKVITLTREYDDGFDNKFQQVKLREPTYKDIFMSGLGRPFEWQPGSNGAIYIAFPDVVAKYAERLLVTPDQYPAIGQLGPADSLRLERAIVGFFTGLTV